MKRQSESQSSSSLSITVRRELEIIAGLRSCPCFLRLFLIKISVDKKWSSSVAGRV